jgi:FkbM family methyltransferase
MKIDFINSLKQIPRKCRVGLYGAGDGGSLFKALLEQKRPDIEIVCFVDDHKTGTRSGLKIVRPAEALSGEGVDYLLVTSAFWPMIRQRIYESRISNAFIVNPVLYYDYLIFSAADARKYAPSINQVERLLNNNSEKNLYRLLINARMIAPEGLDKLCKALESECRVSDQYLDYVPWKKIKTVIEGGVFDGRDTLRFSNKIGSKGFVYGFDPLYRKSKSSFLHKLDRKDNVKVYPYLLWSKATHVPFWSNQDNLEGSGIRKGKKSVSKIRTVSIDEFVQKEGIRRIDFVKLDVEGSEIEVLKGGLKSITKDRPCLAVSIYHRKKDMFQIPLFLSEKLDGYRWHLGHYSKTFWDTVWYAIPY